MWAYKNIISEGAAHGGRFGVRGHVSGEVGKYFLLKARAGQSLLLLSILGGFRS